jgi:isoquinoline 1-oxidoreductase
MGAGESASVPGPAALANALFDATGRLRRALHARRGARALHAAPNATPATAQPA